MKNHRNTDCLNFTQDIFAFEVADALYLQETKFNSLVAQNENPFDEKEEFYTFTF
ncbi:hypothetical protein [Chryseobacterium echinoideorum]|uniref:hypothetical protein n=1 Tax=Chryseobacterium echinoideorum TaxID=1549648 RepID=UPI001628082E|nr:hypothetical protein [Chryseobacterium echinoideorum]